MKVSLLARAAPALLIAGVLTGGLATPGLAQTGSHDAVRPDRDMHVDATNAPAGRGRAVGRGTPHRGSAGPASHPAGPAACVAQVRRSDAGERAQHGSRLSASRRTVSRRCRRCRIWNPMPGWSVPARGTWSRLVKPFRHLYTSLSHEQKREADHLFRAYARRHSAPRARRGRTGARTNDSPLLAGGGEAGLRCDRLPTALLPQSRSKPERAALFVLCLVAVHDNTQRFAGTTGRPEVRRRTITQMIADEHECS